MEFLCKKRIPKFEIPVKSFAIPFFNLLPYCEPSQKNKWKIVSGGWIFLFCGYLVARLSSRNPKGDMACTTVLAAVIVAMKGFHPEA
jgi:uncharacterized membrane protein